MMRHFHIYLSLRVPNVDLTSIDVRFTIKRAVEEDSDAAKYGDFTHLDEFTLTNPNKCICPAILFMNDAGLC